MKKNYNNKITLIGTKIALSICSVLIMSLSFSSVQAQCTGNITNIIATPKPTGTTTTITWNDPACVDASQIKFRVSGATIWTNKNINSAVNSYNLNGLVPNTSYEFKIITKKAGLVLKTSPLKTFTTPCPLLTKPAGTDDFVSLLNNVPSADLYWNTDTVINSCSATDFVVRYRVYQLDSNLAPNAWILVNGPITNHVFLTDLEGNTYYEWQVKIKNQTNSSVFSVVDYFYTIGPVIPQTKTITVANYSFTPSTVNAVIGDTIKWVWSSGTHTTTSTTIPTGATSWNQNMNSNSTIYKYVVTKAGQYNYDCVYHQSMGMKGIINVSGVNKLNATGNNPMAISQNSSETNSLSLNLGSLEVFPNPFETSVTVDFKGIENGSVSFVVFNVIGEIVKNETINVNGNSSVTISTSELKSGMYFYQATNTSGNTIGKGKLLKN